MKIIIFGATGGTGQELITQALGQGFEVTAFVRNPKKLKFEDKNLRAVQGDVLDIDSVDTAIEGHDAVICAIGHPSIMDKSLIRTKGTRNIIKAMKKKNIKRLICQSSVGVGDSVELLPPIYRYLIAPLLMRNLFADHLEQEMHIMESGLDWTIIRPGNLTDGELTKNYQHGYIKGDSIKTKISRADAAHMMLDQVESGDYLHQSPSISY